MPMFTIAVIGRPVCPRQSPERIWFANTAIRSSTSWTCATTSVPSTISLASRGIRRATCSTERFSVTLMRCPVNIASIRSGRPHCPARVVSSASVSSVIRFLE